MTKINNIISKNGFILIILSTINPTLSGIPRAYDTLV